MLTVLAIFFTCNDTAKVSRVLEHQLYTDLCILNDVIQCYFIQIKTVVEII